MLYHEQTNKYNIISYQVTVYLPVLQQSGPASKALRSQ